MKGEVMTDDVAAFLDAVETRTAQATEGPWESWVEGRDGFGGDSAIFTHDKVGESTDLYVHVGHDYYPNWAADQDFIAAARSDVPVLAAGWRKVLALHPRRMLPGGRTYCPACKDPEGRQGVCWYPCPTVAALVEAASPAPQGREEFGVTVTPEDDTRLQADLDAVTVAERRALSPTPTPTAEETR